MTNMACWKLSLARAEDGFEADHQLPIGEHNTIWVLGRPDGAEWHFESFSEDTQVRSGGVCQLSKSKLRHHTSFFPLPNVIKTVCYAYTHFIRFNRRSTQSTSGM